MALAARHTRGSTLLLACVVAVLTSSCIDGDDASPEQPADSRAAAAAPAEAAPPKPRAVRTLRVGRGARGAVVLRPVPAAARPPVVIFVHGWGLNRVANYRRWLRHLALRGNVVIFPRYQLSQQSDPGRARRDAVAGIRAALARVPVDESSAIVAGHSAGGALAFDYAAVSGRSRLPRPLAVFSVYPGRAIFGYPGGIPAADPGRISRDTRLVAMAGANDTVVGQAPARELVRRAKRVPASRRDFVLVRNPRVADHFAPTRSTAAARRTFWRRLDRLIALARR